MRVTDEFVFFWTKHDFLSQWYAASFVHNTLTFTTAEHWMMFQKAVLFAVPNDVKEDVLGFLLAPENTQHIANRILRAISPKEAKDLGREVPNFNKTLWEQKIGAILYQGNKLKMTQNANLFRQFLGYGDRTFVEASPYDTIYGIGMKENHPHATQPDKWRGQNLLGNALTQLSYDLRNAPLASL